VRWLAKVAGGSRQADALHLIKYLQNGKGQKMVSENQDRRFIGLPIEYQYPSYMG